MNIEIIDIEPDKAIIVLNGKLDISGAEKIAMPMSIEAGRRRGLIIDMAAVSFLSSIGLRHLVTAATWLRRKGGQLVLLAPIPAVAEVLRTAGVIELMAIVATQAEARAAIGAA